jgi:hypothetical protein
MAKPTSLRRQTRRVSRKTKDSPNTVDSGYSSYESSNEEARGTLRRVGRLLDGEDTTDDQTVSLSSEIGRVRIQPTDDAGVVVENINSRPEYDTACAS